MVWLVPKRWGGTAVQDAAASSNAIAKCRTFAIMRIKVSIVSIPRAGRLAGGNDARFLKFNKTAKLAISSFSMRCESVT